MSDETGVVEPAAEVQAAAQEQQKNDKELNFERLRKETQEYQYQNQVLQQRLAELERNQARVQEKDVNEDDIPTFGDLKRIREKDLQEISNLKETLADLNMRSRYPDYNDTIKEYLPDVLKEEPDLAQAIQDNPMMHRLAYKLAQASPRYHQERLAKQNNAVVDKMVANATRPTPASARKTMMVQDEDAKIANMSESDIMAMFNMAKARY